MPGRERQRPAALERPTASSSAAQVAVPCGPAVLAATPDVRRQHDRLIERFTRRRWPTGDDRHGRWSERSCRHGWFGHWGILADRCANDTRRGAGSLARAGVDVTHAVAGSTVSRYSPAAGRWATIQPCSSGSTQADPSIVRYSLWRYLIVTVAGRSVCDDERVGALLHELGRELDDRRVAVDLEQPPVIVAPHQAQPGDLVRVGSVDQPLLDRCRHGRVERRRRRSTARRCRAASRGTGQP